MSIAALDKFSLSVARQLNRLYLVSMLNTVDESNGYVCLLFSHIRDLLRAEAVSDGSLCDFGGLLIQALLLQSQIAPNLKSVQSVQIS